MKSKFALSIVLLIIFDNVFVGFLTVVEQAETEPDPYDLMISGLVDRPGNFSYSELQSFSMVSEVAIMNCVGGWRLLYNWTGIPIFFLLSLTGVKAEATEVVFYGSDGFSSSLTIERALHPTTLLALQANGTVLYPVDGYPYRLVVPCKYGYKWVKWIAEIEVVNYDYKGNYESSGYSDKADIPDCSLPSTTPPYKVFQVFEEPKNHSIIALSNSTITSFDLNTLQKQISLAVTGPPRTIGYSYVVIPRELLSFNSLEQWQLRTNDAVVEDRKVLEVNDYMYVYFTYKHDIQDVFSSGSSALSEHLWWILGFITLVGIAFGAILFWEEKCQNRAKVPQNARAQVWNLSP